MEEVQRRSRSTSQHYEGTLEVFDAKRNVTTKRWVYDRMGSHGQSKAVLLFTAPPEVKGVAQLIHNHPDRASDQWMWTPAIQRERRIALQDRSTRFFGTDFTFEDLEEREVAHYDYKLLGEETVDGVLCWRIESRPNKNRSSQYTRSLTWVRKDRYVTVRVEGYKNDDPIRRITYSSIEQIKNIWTARRLEVEDVKRNSRTVLTIDRLLYDVPMKEEDFTLQALRRR
jgi:hypothetical protein